MGKKRTDESIGKRRKGIGGKDWKKSKSICIRYIIIVIQHLTSNQYET